MFEDNNRHAGPPSPSRGDNFEYFLVRDQTLMLNILIGDRGLGFESLCPLSKIELDLQYQKE